MICFVQATASMILSRHGMSLCMHECINSYPGHFGTISFSLHVVTIGMGSGGNPALRMSPARRKTLVTQVAKWTPRDLFQGSDGAITPLSKLGLKASTCAFLSGLLSKHTSPQTLFQWLEQAMQMVCVLETEHAVCLLQVTKYQSPMLFICDFNSGIRTSCF
jgi:hypothetical protein